MDFAFPSAGIWRITLKITTINGTSVAVSETIRVLNPPNITLLYPNSQNIVLKENNICEITYTISSEDSIAKVEAWYSPDGGNTWPQRVGTKEYSRPFPMEVTNHKINWLIIQPPTMEGKIKLKVFTAGGYVFEKKGDYCFQIIPAQPTNLTATSSYPYNSISLTWQDNSNYETGYEIWRKDINRDWTKIATIETPGQGTGLINYTDNSVSPFNDYFYKVRAISGSITSGFSNTCWVTTSPCIVKNPYIFPSTSNWCMAYKRKSI